MKKSKTCGCTRGCTTRKKVDALQHSIKIVEDSIIKILKSAHRSIWNFFLEKVATISGEKKDVTRWNCQIDFVPVIKSGIIQIINYLFRVFSRVFFRVARSHSLPISLHFVAIVSRNQLVFFSRHSIWVRLLHDFMFISMGVNKKECVWVWVCMGMSLYIWFDCMCQ